MAANPVPFGRLALAACGATLLSVLLAGSAFADSPPSPPLTDATALGDRAATPAAVTSAAVTSAAPYVAGPGVRQGIDVSLWQGYIDWPRVARAGIDFTVAKATEGTGVVDPWYSRNAVRARRAGVLFTAYHYARPRRGGRNARAEADYFLRHANLQPGDLVPALDLERTGTLNDARLVRWTLIWLQRVHHKLGVMPMVYSNPGFWMAHMANSTAIAKAGYEILWIGHWDTRHPLVPANKWAGEGWTFWQYTNCGHVAGISGCVDRDTFSGPKLRKLTINHQKQLLRRAH